MFILGNIWGSVLHYACCICVFALLIDRCSIRTYSDPDLSGFPDPCHSRAAAVSACLAGYLPAPGFPDCLQISYNGAGGCFVKRM